jgi:predicted transcriptional regulator
MLMPCEVAVKSVVPSIRAYIAKELTQTYDMRQVDVAALLGITQTAISKYANRIRGATLEISQTLEITSMLNDIASKLAKKQITQQQLIAEFCQVCKTARKTGIMCSLCRKSDPELEPETCQICKSAATKCSSQ